MLLELGVKAVILGHSERRQFFGETDEAVNKKVIAAIAHEGLLPIVCVGENMAQRDAGETLAVVGGGQVKAALPGVSAESGRATSSSPTSRSGQSAPAAPPHRRTARTPSSVTSGRSSGRGAQGAGGRMACAFCTAAASEPRRRRLGLMAMPEIDGALVGGASLKAPGTSSAIVEAAGP